MKTEIISLRALAGMAGVALLLSALPALGADKEPGHGAHSDAPMPKTANSAAALEVIHKLHAELTTQVKGKQLKVVHDTAEKLTAAVNALPAVSKDLSPEKLKRVEGSVKNLAKALDQLHDAADEGEQANSEKHLKTVDSLIGMISSQYGAGGKDAAAKHGH
jgi:uncharacterized protein YlxW (UPF0749 family)